MNVKYSMLAAISLVAAGSTSPVFAQSQNITGSETSPATFSAKFGRPNTGSREVRSFDGSGNNLKDPTIGSVGTQLLRYARDDYDDSASTPRQTTASGAQLRSARVVSNAVHDQAGADTPNSFGTSDWIWQWGQFIDHDISLSDGLEEPASVPLAHGDILDNATHAIPMLRAIYDHGTGTDSKNPRQQVNQVASWIDASNVYGSSQARADELRTFSGGRLKTSRGNLLPFNTNGFPNGNGPTADPASLFLAGDVRCNEQAALAAIHTLFVREHNRLAGIIALGNPRLSDEEIYQKVRRLVGAELQIITYNEFLPALLGKKLRRYRGYDPSVNGAVRNEFSVAAFRFGHSSLSPLLRRLDARGKSIGDLGLRDVFFNAPNVLTSESSLDPIFRGLSTQRHQKIDVRIIDDLRNFLFGPPGAGGMDLASLNIQRGRDHGVPSLNDVRAAVGLKRHRSFDSVTSDRSLRAALAATYASVDDIDLWVGGLAEDPFKASQLGKTFTLIVSRQFRALRDGDRFWYSNNLTWDELRLIGDTRLSDVIRKNTDAAVRESVFFTNGLPRRFAEQSNEVIEFAD